MAETTLVLPQLDAPAPLAKVEAPPPLLARVWMAFDGTISSLLKAAVGETIVSQLVAAPCIRPFGRGETWAPRSGRALERIVLRRGALSGLAYYHARAVVALDRLPAQAQQLLQTTTPFAAALRQLHLDTTYCPVNSTRVTLGALAPLFELPADTEACEFLYDITTGGVAIARMRETFPLCRLPRD